MRIEVASDLDVAPDRLWELIAAPQTFLHVVRPFIGVRHPERLPARWEPGRRYDLRLTVLGLPTVRHRLTIVELDEAERYAQTEEGDLLLPVWRHRLAVAPLPDGRSRYTDTVEVGEGARAAVTRAIGTRFFRHRHRRLRQLVALDGR